MYAKQKVIPKGGFEISSPLICSNESKEVNITRRLNDHLIQYFYSFGIDPDSLDINLFTNKKYTNYVYIN